MAFKLHTVHVKIKKSSSPAETSINKTPHKMNWNEKKSVNFLEIYFSILQLSK